eukprot:6176188-Pleurochrysis_carterae.AAC.1
MRVLSVLAELPYWNLRPDGCTYSTLVDAYGIVGRVADASRMVTAAEEDGVADSRAYSALLRFITPDEVTREERRALACACALSRTGSVRVFVGGGGCAEGGVVWGNG